jgi:hypothetical protein
MIEIERDNKMIVIASEAKQSGKPRTKAGLLRRYASRNDD